MPKEKRDELCQELRHKHRASATGHFFPTDIEAKCSELAKGYGAVPIPGISDRFAEPELRRKPGYEIFFETLSAKLAEHWMLLSLVLVIWLIPPALRYVTTDGDEGKQ